jgi:hypothetical protein
MGVVWGIELVIDPRSVPVYYQPGDIIHLPQTGELAVIERGLDGSYRAVPIGVPIGRQK